MIPPWVIKHLKPIVMDFAKYAFYGIACWFLFNEVTTWVSNLLTEKENRGKLEQALKDTTASLEQKEAELAATNQALVNERAANARISKLISEKNEEVDDLTERLARHDIDKIIARRGPEVVEAAYSRGTNLYFRMWNTETAKLEQRINSKRDNMPAPVDVTGPAENQPASGN